MNSFWGLDRTIRRKRLLWRDTAVGNGIPLVTLDRERKVRFSGYSAGFRSVGALIGGGSPDGNTACRNESGASGLAEKGAE